MTEKNIRTYHCHKCDSMKEMSPKKWGRSNADSYCYCDKNAPFLMSPESRTTLDKKYANVFKNPAAVALGFLGGKSNSPAKQSASKLNGLKGGRPRKSTRLTTDSNDSQSTTGDESRSYMQKL